MDIRVPHLAEGVDSGTVVSVLVKPGDQVEKDQTVVELETNKAVAPIPAPSAGKVAKVFVKEGDSVAVGAPLVSLGEGAESEEKTAEKPAAEPASKPQGEEKRPQQSQPQAQESAKRSQDSDYQYESKSGTPPPASPAIRKVASELGIDLTRVKGSEHGGRITMADVRAYILSLQKSVFTKPAKEGGKSGPVSVDFSKWGPIVKKPLTQLRKTISQAMSDSWNSIPRVTQFDDIDITALMALRKKYAADYEKMGARLTLTSFVVKAAANVLEKHPVFNSSIDEVTQELVLKEYYHIGLAVDTEHGLMVPVLRNADRKDLYDISLEIAELAEKTRGRKLSVEDMRGGTFTISNQGGIGGKHFTPIVNKPEVAILGLGRGYPAAVPGKAKIETRILLPVGLSYDHRAIDGGQAARFIVDFAEALNSFSDQDLKNPKNGVKHLESARPDKKSKKKGKQ